MKFTRTLNIKKLPLGIREKIYDKLINGNYYAEIDINAKNNYMRNVDVLFAKDSHHDSDCGLSHFGYNFYCRTNRAVKGVRYKHFTNCLIALKKLIKNYFSEVINTSNMKIYYKGIKIFEIEFYI